MDSAPKTPSYILVDGFRLPGAFYPLAFQAALQYKARADDVFMVTYPKCGSTWMQYILYLLYNRGNIPTTYFGYLEFSPHIEMFGVEFLEFMNRPGVIKTHLPADMAPYSPTVKYIWVVRNPKDACLSYYHHTENTRGLYDFKGGKFDDYFELFIKGEVDFGDYFDHVLSWYNKRSDPNVLMVTYEDMKKDITTEIRRVAGFLGDAYGYSLDKEPEVLQAIVDNCSFEKMKTISENVLRNAFSIVRNPGKITPAIWHLMKMMVKNKGFDTRQCNTVRKGIVGEWRNVFSDDQNRRMDEKIEKRLGGTELLAFWKNNGSL